MKKKQPPFESSTIPSPPHPILRREPLPGYQPKPASEDEGAPERLKTILQSPSYRQADQDIDFLNQDDTRGAYSDGVRNTSYEAARCAGTNTIRKQNTLIR